MTRTAPTDISTQSDGAPLFSVVIATYNYGHFVERAIESVLAQTCQDFELIVVDDGSTDDTPERIRKFGDRLRYVRKENGGQSTAYNLGADLASGHYIYILDADDELLPDALERFAHAIRSAPAGDVLCIHYGGYVSVSQDGAEQTRKAVAAPDDPERRLNLFLRRRITGLQNCTSVVPKAIFEHFRYPENLRNNTDIVFFGQIVARHPAIKLDAVVARIHEHPQRTRNQLDRVLAAGTTPVDTLFQAESLPPKLMRLKRVYLAQRLRSIARQCYFAGDYVNARNSYFRALLAKPAVMLQLTSVKRLILATLKSLRVGRPLHETVDVAAPKTRQQHRALRHRGNTPGSS